MIYTEDDAHNFAQEIKENPTDAERWYKLGLVYLSLKTGKQCRDSIQTVSQT